MFKASKYCPRCGSVFPIDVRTCVSNTCRTTNKDGHRKATELWIVEMLPGGARKYHRPGSLNRETIKRLERANRVNNGAPDDAA